MGEWTIYMFSSSLNLPIMISGKLWKAVEISEYRDKLLNEIYIQKLEK